MFLFEWFEDGKNILAEKVVYQNKHFFSFLLLVIIKFTEGQYKAVINGIWTIDYYKVTFWGLAKCYNLQLFRITHKLNKI